MEGLNTSNTSAQYDYWNSMVYCDDEERVEYFGTTQKAIYGTWLGCIIVIATLGNFLVILVILTNRSMRDVSRGTNMFLLSVAVADLMVGAVMAPIALFTMINECWRLPVVFCTINSFLNSVLLVASIHNLMYISIYKFMSINRVSKGIFQPVKRCIWTTFISLAWGWGVLLALLTTQLLSRAVYKPKTMQCGPQYPYIRTANSIMLHFINILINILIPYSIMTFCYVQIYRRIRANSADFDRRASIGPTERNRVRSLDTVGQSHKQEEAGVVKTLFIVLLFFLFCWLPYFVYTNFGAFVGNKGDIPTFFNPVAYCFLYMNSACNPIIYAFRFPEFRAGYKQILKKPAYIITFGDNVNRVELNPLNYERDSVFDVDD